MDKVKHLYSPDPVVEQAAAWIMRLESTDVSDQDVEDFVAWLEAEPAHKQAFRETVGLWEGLDELSLLAGLIPLERGRTRKTAPRYWKPAAAVLCGLVLMAVLMLAIAQPDADYYQELATPVGGYEQVSLPDGSFLRMNTATRVTVDYTGEERAVRLKAGEAHFEVASDADRPFVVYAGNGRVAAIGTAFNVQLEGRRVNVTVTEGVVEVAPLSHSNRESRIGSGDKAVTLDIVAVSAGHRVEYEEQIASVDAVSDKNIDRDLAWQRGMLIFEGVSLEEAIAEITRYTERKIIIADPALKSVRVGGYFRSGATDEMLDVFESSFGIDVTRMSDDLVVLSAQKTDHNPL